MRLHPEKIDRLAELIHDHLSRLADVRLNAKREDVIHLIREIITEDLKAEDDIEAEARRILDEHQHMMRMRHVSYDQLLRKTKEKLARDRGMVL